MRDLTFFVAMVFFLPMAFSNAFIAYILWGWSGLLGVNEYLYGFMSGLGYVQIFAGITLFTLLFFKNKNRFPAYHFNRTTGLLLIFAVHGLICASLAYPGLERNWELYSTLLKTILFCALMPLLAFNRFRIHCIVLMIVFGISFHGILDGLKFISSAGSHKAQSLSKFGDNNYFGMIILMVLPFLVYLFRYSQKIIFRNALIFILFLNTLTIISTQSRGALSGLVVVSLFYISKTKNKITGILILCIGMVFISEIASDSWKSRMQTIQSAQEDSSFLGRVRAWQVSSAIALNNPAFGGGFRAVQSHDVWNRFKDSPGILPFFDVDLSTRSGIAAHSIWFEVLGDQGFIGLTLFLLLFFNAFKTRNDIKKIIRSKSGENAWAMDLADVTCVSLIAYCVSGSLLSAAYFELPYICFILLETIKLQQKREILEVEK